MSDSHAPGSAEGIPEAVALFEGDQAVAALATEALEQEAQAFVLDGGDLLPALEAILMVAAEPVSVPSFASVTGMKPDQIEEALHQLARDYDGQGGGRQRGFELRRVDDGWRIFSRPVWSPWVARFVAGADTAQLTQAALETLAIVAYRQPVTRTQIARVRGVNVDGVLRTLLARDLVEEVGTTATGAHLFGTTTQFLERMGLSDVSELVPLAPFMPGPDALEELGSDLED